MGRIISLTIYCRNGKGKYKAYFEEQAPQQWVGIKSEKLPDRTFFEKLFSKSADDYKKKDASSFKTFGSFKSKGASMSNMGHQNYDGEFFSGNLKCPSCGGTGFVKCGVCGELTCNDNISKNFCCAVCGNKGIIEGSITSLSADSQSNKTSPLKNKKLF